MKKITLTFVAALAITFSSFSDPKNDDDKGIASASHDVQISVGTHALIEVVGKNGVDIQLSPKAPETAGEALSFQNVSDKSLWLNYSNLVTKGSSNKITAAYSGSMPTGLALVLSVGAASGSGVGQLGTENVSDLVLTDKPNDVLKNIKNCYTGIGESNGHQLTYRLEQAEDAKYEDISAAASTPITITYTITAQ